MLWFKGHDVNVMMSMSVMKKYTNHKYPTNIIVINNLEDVLLLLIELISFGQEPASLIDILLTK